MADIQRWEFIYDSKMWPDPNGDYVTYADHVAVVTAVVTEEREAAAQRLKVVRDAADVALLGTLQTTRDRVIAAIDALEKP